MVGVLSKLFPKNYESQSFFSPKKDVLTTLYSDYDVKIFGSDKEQNLKSIRSYQYHQELPWIAKIANRQDNVIAQEWVMVRMFRIRFCVWTHILGMILKRILNLLTQNSWFDGSL